MKLSEYIESRLKVISSSIAVEQLAGNEVKLGCERAAQAELRGLENFLSSADYTVEPVAQPSTAESAPLKEPCPGCRKLIKVDTVESCPHCGYRF